LPITTDELAQGPLGRVRGPWYESAGDPACTLLRARQYRTIVQAERAAAYRTTLSGVSAQGVLRVRIATGADPPRLR
jgi:hypothetical protein